MFKWIQLSDLHFQENENLNIEEAREKLIDYLEENIKKCDAIFLLGDYRFAAKSDGDINKIAAYVNQIKQSVGAKYVICLPGNHDLQRSPLRDAVIDGVINTYKPNETGKFDQKILSILKEDFEFYNRICNSIGTEYYINMREQVHCTISLQNCNLVLLNTAIIAGKDQERGSLVFGAGYVKDVMEKIEKSKPTIVMGHHGASFWERSEQKSIYDIFEKYGVKLFLCGHEHALYSESIGNDKPILQITTGCIKSDSDTKIDVGFCFGEIDSQGKASFKLYNWHTGTKSWSGLDKKIDNIYLLKEKKKKVEQDNKLNIQNLNMPEREYGFELNGHTLLGNRGLYGIKYFWKRGEERVESLAFNRRLCEPEFDIQKEQESNQISAYTTSVSFGCILSANSSQCRFCETGSKNFRGFLSAEEIALQNIFMAAYDADCPSYPEVRSHKREFSFMGQGEAGYNYPAIREAIRLTDFALKYLKQEVHRYNISTCGITNFVPSLIRDISDGIFENDVTLHFSLHASGDIRTKLMPINAEINYKDFIKCCEELFQITETKIGVGLLMFKGFQPVRRAGETEVPTFTLSKEILKNTLLELNPEIFRIDLSDLNRTSVVDKQEELSNEEARELLGIAKEMGFEAKIFSSFASEQNAGCGMLGSEYVNVTPDGEKTIDKYNQALKLLNYAKYSLNL